MIPLRPEVEEMNRLYKAMEETYHAAAVAAGLSDSGFLILYALAELGDGCTQQEIARHYYASKQTIHSSIKGLEKKGYLTMAPGPGRDRKILLTPTGRRALEDKLTPVFQRENQVIEELDPEEIKTLLALTRKYVAVHRRLLGEGGRP